ncbi:(2Fe-2S)-binding protein [Kibdelosporangium persicum]|uniref:Xanthine dehydrogenase YagT iron-sulfur-binding subunit n=1 Tax=Kibdelosporangium persicum TaxID=2698649 RepID=A0ABX2FHB7_9PSEU|nr:2Fe-2S iron-sulfur cluster-binding protein [Kibdelosporangium persicum]NRN70782.1 Xanthine dehydrogenase YagT iron-sulfur-binding subunit [Kibdelosporangium persicum]
MVDVTIRVNGQARSLDIPPQVSLLDALRERFGLTGPKKGCDQGACGACTVLADGERINSCLALAVQYDGREITTIEGVDDPLQTAFVRNDGLQCGYCTPGQICSALGMLAEYKDGAPSAVTEPDADPGELTEEEIRERMSGNLCRCGAYNGIVKAIQETAALDTEEVSS